MHRSHPWMNDDCKMQTPPLFKKGFRTPATLLIVILEVYRGCKKKTTIWMPTNPGGFCL